MTRRARTKGKNRGGEPTSLATLVRAVYPGRADQELASLHAFRWWFRAVPPRVYERALPVKLRSGVLTIHTANSTWASELSFLKPSLLASVQRHAQGAQIRDLRFKVGPMPTLDRPGRERHAPEVPPLPLSELPSTLARALASVRDDALRERIQTAASSALARSEARRRDR